MLELPAITQVDLLRAFDPMTITRGSHYAHEGRVHGVLLEEDDRGLRISAEVVGAGRSPYRTRVWVGDGDLRSECSCPVGWNCKHGVAVLQTMRSAASARPVRQTPVWRRALDEVVRDLEARPPTPVTRRKLALEVDLPPLLASRWGSPPKRSVQIRPLREGKRGNWIKTGISWNAAQLAEFDVEHDREQMGVLAAFARAHRGHLDREPASLAGFGPQLFHLLEDAHKVGIPLLPGPSVSRVEILDEPLEIVVDAIRDDHGGHLRVGVWLGGEFHAGEGLDVLGRPAHGVALLGGEPSVVRLARLARLAPSPVLRLVDVNSSLEIPPGDTDTLVDAYLPRLRQSVGVTSSDGSIDLPEEVPPTLQAVVTWHGVEARLEWQWAYGDTTFRIDDSRPASEIRRPLLEAELLAAASHWRHLQPAVSLSGIESLAFVDEALPALLDDDAVEVVVVGDAPDFREATGDPEIEFVADDASTDWLDLSVVITIDGVPVPLADILAALTTGQELILLPGGLYVSTDRPEFARLAELVAAAAELQQHDHDGLRVSHLDLGVWEQLAALGIVDAQAARWVDAARALIHHQSLPEIDLSGVATTPRDYQLQGMRWLVHLWQLDLGGILADDMGLGKTLQTLGLISHARAAGAAPFLVVAPTSVVGAWVGEAAPHTPTLDVRAIDASQTRRGTTLAEAVHGADVVVTSYTLLRLEADAYAACAWGGIVLDEAQTVKNHQSKTYQAVRLVDAPFRLAVTGTPFENRLMELWSLLSIVAPGLYPWPKRFAELVARPVERQGDRAALERFKARVRPFVLRRSKELVATELPPKQEQVLDVALHPRHRKLYDTWLQKERQSILGLVDDFDRNRVAIFSALTRLRQLSLDPALVDDEHDGVGSAKTESLIEHLHEVTAEGHRALVFSQFTGYLQRVRNALDAEGISSRYLDGSTRNRAAEIDAFKGGDGDVFLISLKAGGVGLTLTEADYVFVLDPWWNPAAEAQAVDRTHRIGQARPVMVYRMVSTGTIEEKVMALKERKAALFASVFTGDGAVGSGIDADDVRALFD